MTARARSVLALLFGAVLLLAVLPAAYADGNPAVTIGDLRAAGTGYQGVLTFRATQAVQVDPSSVTATVDGKQVPITVQSSSHLTRTALLVIDTSGSMGASGMQTVRQATSVYLREAPSDVKVGVLRFASRPVLVLKPTTDRARVQQAVNGLTANGETALYAATQQAAKVLGNTGDRSIVLLSDGAETQSKQPAKDLAAATAALRSQGIRVDVVRFNNTDPGAEKALAQFARAGGGSDVLATNTAGVAAAFQSSAQALNSQSVFTLSPSDSLSGEHDLTISGTASGRRFTVSQRMGFGAIKPGAVKSTAPTAQTPAQHPTLQINTPHWVTWLAGGVIGLAIFLISYVLLAPPMRSRRERRIATVQSYLAAAAHRDKPAPRSASPSAVQEALVGWGERIMDRRASTAKTMQLIQRADLPLRAGEWLLLRVLSVILSAVLLAFLLDGVALLGLAIGAIAGFFIPVAFLRFKASRRTAAFEKQLPQVMTLVATSLRSGFGLPQALEAVARDSAEPAAKELSRALAQVRIGSDLSDALDDVADRMGTQSLHMAVMAIRIQRQVGGNLAETLDTTAHTLREREALRGQVRALSAEGRLSAAILIALPICLFLYMAVVSYDYVALLWTTLVGVLMLVGACVLMVIGVFWMRKTVQIEV